jgi:hypothetical protein
MVYLLPARMFEVAAPSTVRALAELEIPAVRAKVDEMAARMCGSADDVDDLVASALALVCDPARRPWNPVGGGLARHLGHVMRDLRVERTVARATRLGLELREGLASDDVVALKVFDAICRGVEDHRGLGAAVGLPVKEIEKALRRVAYRAARIEERDDAERARGRRPTDVVHRSDEDRS